MRRESRQLPNPATLAASEEGAAVDVADLTDKWVQLGGFGTFTVEILGSLDGTDYVVLASGSAAAIEEVAANVRYLKVRLSAYTSGTPKVTIAGRNARTI